MALPPAGSELRGYAGLGTWPSSAGGAAATNHFPPLLSPCSSARRLKTGTYHVALESTQASGESPVLPQYGTAQTHGRLGLWVLQRLGGTCTRAQDGVGRSTSVLVHGGMPLIPWRISRSGTHCLMADVSVIREVLARRGSSPPGQYPAGQDLRHSRIWGG